MNSLIVFVKNPILGQVKTRLAKTVGEAQALDIYKELLRHTQQLVSKLNNTSIHIYYADFVCEDDLWNGFQKHPQRGDDLGERMENAFREQFDSGDKKVLVIGSDCLEIELRHVEQAFETLDNTEIVLGPAQDGGYYLLGMQQLQHCVFREKAWSTDTLLQTTVQELAYKNVSYECLEMLSDIDEWQDYQRYKQKTP